jgi:hypothetical protein
MQLKNFLDPKSKHENPTHKIKQVAHGQRHNFKIWLKKNCFYQQLEEESKNIENFTYSQYNNSFK